MKWRARTLLEWMTAGQSLLTRHLKTRFPLTPRTVEAEISRKRHRGGRNRHNRVRVTARNRKTLPETTQDSHFHGSLRKTCRIKVLLPALSKYPPPVVDSCGERAKGRRQEVCYELEFRIKKIQDTG